MIYWVTLGSSDSHDRTATVPDLSPSKSGDPESGGAESSAKASKVLFKLGHSKKESPPGVRSMQVLLGRSLLLELYTLSIPFNRSTSLPSASTNTVDHRLMSRSTSYRKCPLFDNPVPTRCERKTVLLILMNKLSPWLYLRGIHSFHCL